MLNIRKCALFIWLSVKLGNLHTILVRSPIEFFLMSLARPIAKTPQAIASVKGQTYDDRVELIYVKRTSRRAHDELYKIAALQTSASYTPSSLEIQWERRENLFNRVIEEKAHKQLVPLSLSYTQRKHL